MGAEAERPIRPEKSGETKKPYDQFAANRRFERFMMGIDPGFRLDARRPDQGGVWDEHDLVDLARQNHPLSIDPEEGKLICTITYKPEEGKVIYDYPDGRHIEK